MEVKIYNDVEVNGSVIFAKDLADFPTNPRPGEIISKQGQHFAYTKISGSLYSWLPIGVKQTAYVHSQGVASTTWIIEHNLNSVNYGLFVYDAAHNLVIANHTPINANSIEVSLSSATAGTAVVFTVDGFSANSIASGSVQSDTIEVGGLELSNVNGALAVDGAQVALSANLATVASTGSYNDLINKPSAVSSFTNDSNYQTGSQVDSKIQAVVGAAPAALDTLAEIADKLADNDDVVSALTNTISGKADSVHTHTAAQVSGLATVATSGSFTDLSNKPLLGTAASRDVAATGNANSTQVVKGDDTRLSDARTPTAHNHSEASTSLAGFMSASDKTKLDGIATGANNYVHPTSGVTAGTYRSVTVSDTGHVTAGTNPTTLAGYGITDAASVTHNHSISNVSGLQTALDSKQATITGAATTITGSNLTASRAVVSDASGKVAVSAVTSTELGYVSGVTSAIQTQLDGKSSTNHTHSTATTSTAGFMSASDKTKLDGIATGANNYTLPVATSTVLGGIELASDTVQSVAANSVSSTASRTYGLQVNAAGQGVVNVPWSDTTYSNATTSVSGLMSSTDKTKLDSIAANANNYTHPTSGVSAGTYKSVTVDNNGHVTAGTNPTTLAGYGITDAASATHTHSNYLEADLGANYLRSTPVAVAATDINCTLGNYFTKTINGNTTFTFSNAPAAKAYGFTFELTHTSGTVTWPASVSWPKGTAPTLTANKTHLFVFVTDDGGARWRGAANVDYTN